MKILVVQESDWLLRGPHQQHHLMERMALKGHEIRVVDYEILWKTRGKNEFFSRKKVFDNVSRFYDGANITVVRPGIVKLPILDKLSILFSHRNEIRRQIDEFEPDVVVGFGILNTYLAMKLAKKNGIPFIYYLIDALHRFVSFKPFQFIAKEFEKKTLRDADKVITINEALKDYAVKMGADPDESIVLSAGIDLDRFNPAIDGSEIRKEYGIEPDDIVLFFMGWLYEFSGLREVAVGLATMISKYPHVKLMIVGEGDLFDELKGIKEKYGCEENIILTGQQPYEKIPTFVSASDICLLPAYNNDVMRDIVPIKMYEYMACGKPIISTSLSGILKEFGDGNGVIYVDEPTEVLERAIKLKEQRLIEIYGIKSRNFVEGHSWYLITNCFDDLIQNLIERL